MMGIVIISITSLLLHLEIVLSSSLNQEYSDEEVSRNVSVPLGSEAVLSCVISDQSFLQSTDILEASWIRADDQTVLFLNSEMITTNPRFTVSSDLTYKLHISKVKESDHGCYICEISSTIVTSRMFCIDVLVSPDIEEMSADVTVDEGGRTTLTCKARGHPPPLVYWKREDSQLINQDEMVNSSVLSFSKIRREDGGAYLCIASNNVPPTVSKRIVLTVNFKPDVHVEESRVGSEDGKDVRFVCNCFAFPRPRVIWLFNNLVISHSHKYSLDREESGSLVSSGLRLHSVGPGDFGYYTCVCRNVMGRRVASLELYRIVRMSTTKAEIPNDNKSIIRHVSIMKDEDAVLAEIDDNSLKSMMSAKATSIQVSVLDSFLGSSGHHVSSSSQILASFIYVFTIILLLF